MLDTAHEAGLSGTGRLHDLFLTWEAMSPGDYARGGAVWRSAGAGSKALWRGGGDGHRQGHLRSGLYRRTAAARPPFRRPDAPLARRPLCARRCGHPPLADAAFGGQTSALHLIGAPFQIKVWEALLAIPSGHVTTYSEIAGAIGHDKAVRAVGTAVGRNPISFLIPCHRALRKSGGLGGYHWGLPVKRAMLAWEGARADAETAS
jgi:AraC family transcriptional regulator of adaptative response/methylated-DNA-[protein]-cysteine methyltransferase